MEVCDAHNQHFSSLVFLFVSLCLLIFFFFFLLQLMAAHLHTYICIAKAPLPLFQIARYNCALFYSLTTYHRIYRIFRRVNMFRYSLRFLHTPSIRFTYAIAKNGGKPHGAAAAVAAASSAAVANVFDFYDELPKHLRPHVFGEVEMETIQMGGAAPYVPKHLQKKKK